MNGGNLKRYGKLLLYNLLFLSVLIAIQGELESVQKWKGKIRKENGIIVIENKGSGLYGKKIKDNVKFKEILSLGVYEGQENLVFGRHIMIDVDLNQNIFILDIQNHRLLKFDRNGQFRWKTGRKGQGPGEIESPFDIKTTSDGGIVVVNQGGKLHYFDKDGNFQNMIRLEKVINTIISLSKEKIFANLWIRGQPGKAAAFFSKDGNLINYFPVEYHYGPKLSPRRGYNLGGGFNVFGNRLFLSLPDKYEILEYTMEGKLLRKIKRDIKLKPPFLEDGYRFITKDISGPCYLTSKGFLINKLHIKKEKKDEEIDKTYLDLFNKKFEFLGSYPLREDIYLTEIDSFDNFYFIQTDPYLKLIKCTMKID